MTIGNLKIGQENASDMHRDFEKKVKLAAEMYQIHYINKII